METPNIKQQLEEVIKKNLPEKKRPLVLLVNRYQDVNEEFNECLSQINISLIADEVIKKFIDYLELNPNEDGSTSPNIQHWIEKKQSQLRKLLSNLSPNKGDK